jgi:chemotaxis response regulator CheB
MPPFFTRAFAARLDRASAMNVREAQDGERLVPGATHPSIVFGMPKEAVARGGAERRPAAAAHRHGAAARAPTCDTVRGRVR